MSMNETNTTAVSPLLALGEADADVCADGFCALPPAPEQEPRGVGE
jgi:hypothetical protein